MRWSIVLRSCGTVFDIAGKQSLRANLNTQMGQASFWNNPERAQQVIQQLKPLNGLLKPYEELEIAIADLQALAELSEEDASLEGELESELNRLEKGRGDCQLQAIISHRHDASKAYVELHAGRGR